MSINIGLTSDENYGCIVGFSGKIIDKKNLSERITSKTKILLIHGDLDSIVPSNFLLDAKDFLIREKVDVHTKLIKNCEVAELGLLVLAIAIVPFLLLILLLDSLIIGSKVSICDISGK